MDAAEVSEVVEASSADSTIRLVRCCRAHGRPFYRVVVGRVCDKRHATLDAAAAHFGRAIAADIKSRAGR